MGKLGLESLFSTEEVGRFCFEAPPSEQTPVFASGEGVRLVDVSGRRYLDGISGVFVTCFGYSCEPIASAVAEQIKRLPFSPPLHSVNPLAPRLASELVKFAPAGFNCVKLMSGGSESIEAALRLVRLYHSSRGRRGKFKVISNYNGYHGSTFGSLTLTGRPDMARFGPALQGFVHVWPPDCFSCPFGLEHPSCDVLCASMVERTIESEGPDSVAAIFIEPVIHLVGMAVPPRDYFTRLREICDRHDILLVFDEIVTGFGRTGSRFASDHFGVTPDLMCVGKGLSAGYAPLSAVLMTERVSAVVRGEEGHASFAPSHTYAGNPVAAAAGLAALDMFKSTDVLARVRESGAILGKRLEALMRGRGRSRGVGMLWGLKLQRPESWTQDRFLKASPGKRVEEACMKRNLILRGEADWVVIAPAFTSTNEELEELCGILEEALGEVYGALA